MQISDYIPFNIIKCLYFFDLTHFRGQGRNPYNNFVAFLENLRHHNFVLRLSDLQFLHTTAVHSINQELVIVSQCLDLWHISKYLSFWLFVLFTGYFLFLVPYRFNQGLLACFINFQHALFYHNRSFDWGAITEASSAIFGVQTPIM